MTQQDIRELAKQGNPKALATLINHSLKPKNITSKVGVKDDCIQILLESAQVPDQKAIVPFIRNALIKLEVSLNTVKVYGRQLGEETVAWNQTFELIPIQDTPVISEPIEDSILPPISSLDNIENSIISSSKTRQTKRANLSETPDTTPNPKSSRSIGPLSVGNVVSAALRIYRDRFKVYLRLAFIGALWSIIPIYGWAKFSATSALIARLAYSEVIERPESVDEASHHVMPRKWSFLGAGLLFGLIILAFVFVSVIIYSIAAAIIAPSIIGNPSQFSIIIPLILVASLIFLLSYIWLISRFFVVELPLVMEENVTATSTIKRGWQLTKGFGFHLLLIVSIAIMISLPIYSVVQVITGFVRVFVASVYPANSASFILMYYALTLPLSIASHSILMPFWQSLKAVIYYDLRSRKEGLGLQIRNSR